MARDVSIFFTWLSYHCVYFDWGNPFSLVYGMEVVLTVEVEIPSLRIMTDLPLDEAEWVRNRFDQLNVIDEKILTAICHRLLFKRRMKKVYANKVRLRNFQAGDLVLKRIFLPTIQMLGVNGLLIMKEHML